MKKLTSILSFTTLLACSTSSKINKAAPVQPAFTSEIKQGMVMISEYDCFTCHRIEERSIGPAFTRVAKKYEATDININKLALKIINGGYGNWGKVPMTLHPDLNIDSAKKLVRTILSFKKTGNPS